MAPKTRPDPLDVAIGASVRIRRHQVGMSQESLAAACGVSFQQIQKYENGANRISFSRLVQIALALSCSVKSLMQGLDVDGADEDLDAINLKLLATPGAQEALKLYGMLSEEQQRALMTLLGREAADVASPG